MNSSESISRQHDHHDWDSPNYVSRWAESQDSKEQDRYEAFTVLADAIPFDRKLPIRILDLGAGYGALIQFLLKRFPNATAVCQDAFKEMARPGAERMKRFSGRFEYVFCDFARKGWRRQINGPFEAVVLLVRIT